MTVVVRAAAWAVLVAMATGDTLLAAETSVTEGDVTYRIVDGTAIPEPLTATPGDPAAGAKAIAGRSLGNCLACHAVSALGNEPFHGDLGPSLDGVAERYSVGELRLQIVNNKIVNPDSVMPGFFTTEDLVGVRKQFQGKTILTAQQVEDVVAFLSTLKE